MPAILVTELEDDIESKVDGLGEGFPDFVGPRTWCLFLNRSALAAEGSSPSVLQCVPLTLTKEEQEEIRWYLEDFAQHDSFERSRAKTASDLLLLYGKNLASAISWNKLIRPEEAEERLVLDILALNKERHHVFWEALENPEVWGSIAPPAIHVVRSASTLKKEDSETAVRPDTQVVPESRNILIVASRSDADDDIPHRLVSRILHDMIHNREEEFPTPISMEIVRPATWDAFQQHLASHPPGYFQIVHLDMHGLENEDGSTSLAFIRSSSDDPGSFQSDFVLAAQVATVLARHRVDQVVLNACGSAKGRKVEKNAALSIVGAGIRLCVAMSYSVVARAVEIFTYVLYDALLIKNLSLDAATTEARSALRIHSERVSGFGEVVHVTDWVVPIVYRNSSFPWNPKYRFSGTFGIPSRSYFNQPPVGREGDIVRIESNLLISNRPVLMIGQAGMGKTCLLKHLCRWWRDTGLIVGLHYVQFSRSRTWDLDKIFQDLHEKFFEGFHFNRETILSHLRSNRFLLVFDSLESIDFSLTSTKRMLHRDLPRFLQSLSGGKTLVIIASRTEEDYLSQQTVFHYLGSIGTIAGMQHIQKEVNEARTMVKLPTYDSQEDYQYLTHIFKLINGNPMALMIVLTDWLRSKKSPQEYFYSLLAGQPMEFGDEYDGFESFRSVAELRSIVESLVPQGVQNWLPGQILAPFWKVLPEKDIRLYAACYNRKVYQQIGNEIGITGGSTGDKARSLLAFVKGIAEANGETMEIFKHQPQIDLLRAVAEVSPEEESKHPRLLPEYINIDEVFLGMEELDMDAFVKTPLFDGLEAQCAQILEPLKKSLFLTKADHRLLPQHVRSNEYLLVHPILPMVLRAHEAYQQNIFMLAGATRLGFSFYYTYRAKKWPYKYHYFSPIWADYREAIEVEFFNFLGAVACYIDNAKGVKGARFEHSFLIRMLMTVHRGIGADANRLNILTVLWEKALDSCLEQESIVISQLPVKSMTEKISSLFLSAKPDQANDSKQDEGLEDYQRMFLFSVRMNSLQVIGYLIVCYRHVRSTKQNHFRKIAKRLVSDMMHDGIPPTLDATSWKKLLEYYLYFTTADLDPEIDVDGMFAKRQGMVELVTGMMGVESLPTEHTSWADLPMDLLAKSSQAPRITTAVIGVRRAIKEGRLDDARKMLDGALKMEMFDASNDLANKATLLGLRAKIHEKKEEWEDALRAYDEEYAFEKQAAERHGATLQEGDAQRLKREWKRQLLLRKIKDGKGPKGK